MGVVSIRELSNNASAVIRRVNGGETVQVTSHGAVVAVIMPVSQRERAQAALVSAGVLTGGSGNLGAILGAEPLVLDPRQRRAADVLADLRDEDDR
ncbi:MAG: type II toxin-antitoxin system Phd/YefM family antitoxin [Natronosporangium sp.]